MKSLLKTRNLKEGIYEYEQYQCPICKKWLYKSAKYIHFTSTARKEAMEKSTGVIKKTPHLDFYIKNTKEVIIKRRDWVTIL